MYEYIFIGFAGCFVGFIGGSCLCSDQSRIHSMDLDIDDLENQLNASRQYTRYLEGILNNSTGVTTESSLLVDASANLTQVASVDRIINTPPTSPVISRNRGGITNQPTVPPPSPVARIRQSISLRPTAPELPRAMQIHD